jgi:hypothetical protein
MQCTNAATAAQTRVPSPPHVEDHSVDHHDDRRAIEALIADVERGFNTNDTDTLVAGPG